MAREEVGVEVEPSWASRSCKRTANHDRFSDTDSREAQRSAAARPKEREEKERENERTGGREGSGTYAFVPNVSRHGVLQIPILLLWSTSSSFYGSSSRRRRSSNYGRHSVHRWRVRLDDLPIGVLCLGLLVVFRVIDLRPPRSSRSPSAGMHSAERAEEREDREADEPSEYGRQLWLR
jgi:hypothetical protein